MTEKISTKWKAHGEGMGLFERTHIHPKTYCFWMELSAVSEQQ
jgi:hypothetical protein